MLSKGLQFYDYSLRYKDREASSKENGDDVNEIGDTKEKGVFSNVTGMLYKSKINQLLTFTKFYEQAMKELQNSVGGS